MNKIHTLLILSALFMASTVANADDTTTPTIGGSVFGGGRMANVSNTATQVSGTDNSVTCTTDIYACTITGGVYGGNDITGDDWQKDHGSESAENHSARVTIHNTDADPTVISEVYGGGNGNYTYCFTYYQLGTSSGSYDYAINAAALKANTNLKWLFTQKAWTGGVEVKVYPADATEYTSDNLKATYTIAAGSSLTNAIPIIHNSTVTIGDAVDPDNEVVRIGEVYGGAKNAWVSGTTTVTVNSATIGKVFAGNNLGGVVYNTSMTINGTKKPATEPTTENFGSFAWTNVGSWEDATNGYGIGEAYGGGNAVDVQTAAQVTMNGGYVGTLFGGNNLADMSAVPNVLFTGGNIGTSYGGGNAGDMQGCEAAWLNISQYLNNDLFEANNSLPAFTSAGITFTDYCNTEHYLYFYGAETLLQQGTGKSLKIGTVYGGCRAANVDLSTYVRVSGADYIGTVYGGCDMAGSVGAKPTESTGVTVVNGTPLTKAEMDIEYYSYNSTNPEQSGYAVSTTKLPQYFPIINLSSIVTLMSNTVSGNLFAGGNGDYIYEGTGTAECKAYAIKSDGTKGDLLTTFCNLADDTHTKVDQPWTVSSIAAMEGGTLSGTLYGGGNNADVGQEDSEGRVYILLGKTARGILSSGETGPKVSGTVYAGGKKSNVYGTVDVLVKAGCDINTLYAGNDISGKITGNNRGNYLSGTDAITTVLKGTANDGTTANNTYCGWRLDQPNGDADDKAQVYVRVEGAGQDVDGVDRSAAKITTLYGGSNGDYDYTTSTSPYYGLSKPVSKSNFLDVKGIVTTCYGGGNAADVEVSNTYITGDAQVTRAFGGGNSATVTKEVNLYLDCDGTRSTSADWVNGTELVKGNEPNVRFIFAGNNLADMDIVPAVTLWKGSVMTVYGGGNKGNMTGYMCYLTNQVDYMSNDADISKAWSTQMANNFPGITWTSDADNSAITFDLSKVICFKGTNLIIDSKYETKEDGTPNGNNCGLVVGEAYAGCRAANVDNGAYVRVSHCDYIKNVYGGCDIAGSVGAKPGVLPAKSGDAKTMKFSWVSTDGTINWGTATLNNSSDIPMWNTATWIYFTGGTCDGNIYGSGNGNYTYADDGTTSTVNTRMGETVTFDNTKTNKPWVSATTLFIEGGTINGNIYGGGNKADVGHQFTAATKYWDKEFSTGEYLQSSSFLCIGKGDLGREKVTIKGDVFGGGRISNVHGTIDIVTLGDVNINRLFAGNDISGSVTGNFRGTRFATTANNITCMIGNADNMENQTLTYDGTELTTEVANVYVRLLPGGHFGTVFGGGNGDYNYSDPSSGVVTVTDKTTGTKIDEVTAESAEAAKPSQSATWVDILAHVGNAYGGGNAAKIGKTNICLVGDGKVGVTTDDVNDLITGKGNIFGGCKSADVTQTSHVRIEPYAKGSTTVPYVNGNVFGGCDISGNVGDCELTCTDTNAHLLSDHSNKSTAGHAHVDVLAGTITGRVFGGGNGLEDATGTAYYTGTPIVTGTKPADVFSYPEGSTYAGKQLPVCQNTYVVVKNATIGSTTGSDTHTCFGGGQGAGTKVMHNVFMNLGTTSESDNTTVNGVLYGGSYAGFVNSTCSDVTQTTLLGNGTTTSVKGDIYGGSYGNYVRGAINLNINNISVGVSDDAEASIYAGNNNAGQPECEACINYVGNDCNTTLYGGGNMAPFYGTTRLTFTKGTIGYLYGGGNHAPVYGNTIVEVLGGHVCHDVYGGGNNGAVLVNKGSDTEHNSYGKDYGGNTLVIVRDDCLQLGVDSNGKNPGDDGYVNTFATDATTTNYQANRDNEKSYSTYFSDGDPYAEDMQLYVLKPNSDTDPVKTKVTIDGNVYGGGNDADVEGKTNVIIGNK